MNARGVSKDLPAQISKRPLIVASTSMTTSAVLCHVVRGLRKMGAIRQICPSRNRQTTMKERKRQDDQDDGW